MKIANLDFANGRTERLVDGWRNLHFKYTKYIKFTHPYVLKNCHNININNKYIIILYYDYYNSYPPTFLCRLCRLCILSPLPQLKNAAQKNFFCIFLPKNLQNPKCSSYLCTRNRNSGHFSICTPSDDLRTAFGRSPN